MPENGSLIAVKNISKCYGSIKAVQDISFEVNKGEIFGLVGPNGSGKTTMLEIIEGLRKQDSGTVTIAGSSVRGRPGKLKEVIGVQFQTTALFDNLTVVECVQLFRSFYKKGRDVKGFLPVLGLEEIASSRISSLSAGQRQRVGLAIALVNDPDYVFLDEPTTNLDPEGRQKIWDIIRDIKNGGRTVILSTNDIDEAESLCDRIIIISRGKAIALDSPSNLKAQFGGKRLEDVFLRLTRENRCD